MSKLSIESVNKPRNPGAKRVWHVTVYRQSNGAIVASAIEGDEKEGWFQTIIFEDPSYRFVIDAKRLTKKVIEQGVEEMVDRLRFNNLVKE